MMVRGVRSALPDLDRRRFRFTLAFVRTPTDDDVEALMEQSFKDFVTDHDPQLYDLLAAAQSDLEAARVKIFVGDPHEDLELAIEEHEEAHPDAPGLMGFVVFSRQADLKRAEKLPETNAERDALAGPFERTPAVDALFAHLDRAYLHFLDIDRLGD